MRSSRWSDRLPALSHRDFRNFQIGSFISNVGNRMQFLAILYHVYQQTHSNTLVGLLGVVRVIPLIIFGLFGGVIADHFDRRKVIFVTQIALLLIAVCLAMVTIYHLDSVWMIYAIVAAGAVANAFNGPARQAVIVNLVPREVFPNAASINGITWRLSDILGPVLTGLTLAWTSPPFFSSLAWVYIFNAASFLAVIWATFVISPQPPSETDAARNFRDAVVAIKEGFAFFKQSDVVRNTMMVDFWATFFAGAEALLPAFTDLQGWGKHGLAVLAAAMGTGALIASLFTALMPTFRYQGLWVLRMIGLFGLFTIAYGLSSNLWLAFICLALIGAADMVSTVLRQTIRQLTTPDRMRGRLGSIGMILQVSGPQLGDAESGLAADGFKVLGLVPLMAVRASIVLGGIGSLTTAGWWMKRSALSRHEFEGESPTPKENA